MHFSIEYQKQHHQIFISDQRENHLKIQHLCVNAIYSIRLNKMLAEICSHEADWSSLITETNARPIEYKTT